MSEARHRALFADLVFNENGQMVEVVRVGTVPHYAVPDGDFLRHVEAEQVDRAAIRVMQERISGMSDLVVEGMIQMMGSQGLFTRETIEHAIRNMERLLEPGAIDVDEFRTVLWMSKFRVVVNRHGEVLEVDMPGWQDVAGE